MFQGVDYTGPIGALVFPISSRTSTFLPKTRCNLKYGEKWREILEAYL
tara:strand:- start:399 stop:542 length:144 start_codon:yes stop_codon:yes gene_type:complete